MHFTLEPASISYHAAMLSIIVAEISLHTLREVLAMDSVRYLTKNPDYCGLLIIIMWGSIDLPFFLSQILAIFDDF